MTIRTAEQYIESLKDDRVVYCMGERVKDVTVHPILRIAVNWLAMDYKLQHDPKYKKLLTEVNEHGELTSFSFLPKTSRKELLRLREVVKLCARIYYGKPPRSRYIGADALSALTVVAGKVDKAFNTDYSQRVNTYREFLQKTDAAIAVGMTDVKGDRGIRPSQQKLHKDYYVRIVEERKDGIVVRGAKAHVCGAPLCNEIVVIPGRAMREDDKEYAVSFAIPANTKGITFISAEPTIKEPGNYFDYPVSSNIYINAAMVIFNDVFIPEDRIFLKKEWQHAGDITYMFGNFHRTCAETCRAAELELLTGAAALMAEYNGVERASHIQDKLTWLISYAEAIEVLSRAACENCISEQESNLVYPNPVHANIAKFFFTDNWHQATKFVQDIAGGIVAIAPSAKDYDNPEIHELLDKYLGGKNGTSSEYRIRLAKLIRDLTSCYDDVTALNAEGSLAAEKLSIHAIADFDRYKAAASRAAGIKDGIEHPVFSQLPQFPVE